MFARLGLRLRVEHQRCFAEGDTFAAKSKQQILRAAYPIALHARWGPRRAALQDDTSMSWAIN